MTWPLVLSTSFVVFGLAVQAQTSVDSTTQSRKILERLMGVKVPGDSPVLASAKPLVEQGQFREAAKLALQRPEFLNVTVKQMALRMSTREESLRTPFNDFTAMVVGAVRDDLDARLLITGNLFYLGDPAKMPQGSNLPMDPKEDYLKSNNHFEALDKAQVDLGQVLTRQPSQVLLINDNSVIRNPDPAGVLTSRAFLEAHALDGTNRRLVEFTFREFMCVPIEKWADVTASDARIGRDIDRFPGGDHLRFQTKCKGCHSQMDSFRGAFAKTNFRDRIVVRSSGVEGKLNKNNTVFKDGYVTTDTSWVNNSRGPANEDFFGWRGENVKSGADVQGLALLIANSSRFSECMVQRVFEAVCRQPLAEDKARAYLKDYGRQFESKKYSLKELFLDVAVSKECNL